MARTSLLPGFRFHPTDVELVMYYLKRKVMGKKLHIEAIAEVNIYKFSPWDLPDKSCLKSKDLEWFFFCPREKKYASGVRVKRATENGYWKTTGKDRPIRYNDKTVGTVKTLVFHLGHAPQGERTDWVIHEYRILDGQLAAAGIQDMYVLCKVFKKNGPGPKNGAQYGAPFNEADWADDDVDDDQNHALSLTSGGPSPIMQCCSLPRGLFFPGSTSRLPLTEGGLSPSAGPSTGQVHVDETDDEIVRLLAPFTHDNALLFNENGIIQDNLINSKGKNASLPGSDGCDIYYGLGDLDSWAQMNEDGFDFSEEQKDDYPLNNMLSQDSYIELNDLLPPLNCSAEVVGNDQSSIGDILGSYSHENIPQFSSGGSFTGMDQYASCANQLPVLPEGSNNGDNFLDVLQMVNNQFYQGHNAAYDLDFAHQQPENGFDFTQDMERGTPKKICISRLTESIPASLPSAAEQVALSFSHCDGSSIHIKAEVTHRDGECTNEALPVMMGESSSCWWNLPLADFQEMYLVIVYCCYLNDIVFVLWSDYYRHCYLNETWFVSSSNCYHRSQHSCLTSSS